MNREWHSRINEEVEGFRKALVHYAKACEWDTFEKKAGILFDYLESIERRALEEKFFRVFLTVLAVVAAAVVSITQLDGHVFPALLKYKDAIILAAIAASCFELFFFLNFRTYVKAKMSWYRKRRDQFIRNIKADFSELFGAPLNGRQGLSCGTV
jgi:hypothetical protein